MSPSSTERIPDDLATSLAGLPKTERTRLLEMLFMAADTAFWTVDVDGRSVAFSRGLDMILGHRAGTLRSFEAVEALVHPADHDRVVGGLRTATRGPATGWTDEFRFARGDGSYAVVRARAAFLRERGRLRRIVGALIDVSRAVAMDAELEARAEELIDRSADARSERIRRELVERAVGDAVREWDIVGDVSTWNEAVHDLFGYRPEDVKTSPDWWRDRIHPEDRDRVVGTLGRALEGVDDAWADTYRFRRGDGSYVLVRERGSVMRDAEGRPVRFVAAMRPVPPAPGVPPGGTGVPPGGTDDARRPLDLTVRQAEVLLLIRRGLSNKEIAARLGIGEQAVKEHVSRMLERSGAHNRAALVEAASALDLSLVDADSSDPLAGAGVAVLQGPSHLVAVIDGRFRAEAAGRAVLGRPLRSVLPQLAGQGVIELLDSLFSTGRAFTAREVLLRTERPGHLLARTGALRSLPIRNAHGAVDGILLTGSETSPRGSERRGALRLARQQTLAMRDWPIGALLVDAEGRALDMNDTAAGVPDQARATVTDLMRAALAGGRPMIERRRVADALLSASASPIREAGTVVGATVTFALLRRPAE